MAANYNACINPSALMQKSAGCINLASYLPDFNFEDVVSGLFANGEQGFAYDPLSLITGVYGDSITDNGIPVTVGVADASEYDPVTGEGSVYRAEMYNQSIVNFDTSKSKQYELVIESTGSNPIAVNADLAMGEVLFTVPAGQTVTRIIESVDTIVITSANDVSTATFKIYSLREFDGTYTMYQDAAKTTPVVAVSQPVGYELDRSGNGNHGIQSTASMRPLLSANPQRIDYDADDGIITALAAELTGCTVIRAVPGVGAQILTGQTIPATYTDNTDHCGLIVINRALTATETAQLTSLFNDAAGV